MSGPDLDEMSLGEAAYLRLRADIVSCQLAPGERLTERRLADGTGFGMSPIRDALKRLAHEGLVRILPRKGYQVKPLTIKEVNDLFDFWGILGPEVARCGVAAVSQAQLSRILAGREEIRRLVKEAGLAREVTRRTVEITDEMFTTLAAASGNEYLISAHAWLSGELARVWTLVTDSELLDAEMPFPRAGIWRDELLCRDGDKCADLARESIEQSRRRVLRTLARWPSVITAEVVLLRPAVFSRT